MTIQVILDPKTPNQYAIQIGEHTQTVEMSTEGDGAVFGATPHDLYDAALGACTALTVRWYATHRHIAVDRIEVSVDRDATQERAGLYRLSVASAVTGALTTAQREELLRVMRQCPVHRLMTDVATEISTRLDIS